MTSKPWKNADDLREQCHLVYKALKEAAQHDDPDEVHIRLRQWRDLQKALWEELDRAVSEFEGTPEE